MQSRTAPARTNAYTAAFFSSDPLGQAGRRFFGRQERDDRPAPVAVGQGEFSVLAGSALGNPSLIPLSWQHGVYAECPSSNKDVVGSRAEAAAEPSAPSAMQSAPTLTPRSRILRSSGTRFRHSPAARRIARASCVGAAMVWSRVTVLKSS